MRLLLVEDDPDVGPMLAEALTHAGHVVDHVTTGADALWRAQDQSYDVVILDVGLPDMTGMQVCGRLRASQPALPLLMVTGRSGVRDRVHGLDAGADDYMSKPVSLAELQARLRALARRSERPVLTQHRVDDLVVEPATHTVRRGARDIPLAGREYALVELLARNGGQVVTRAQLVAQLWDAGADVTDNALDVLVASVRRKLEGASEAPLLLTVRGSGYRLGLARTAQVEHR
jgi:two-component system OmpR family response regulator